MTVRLFAILGCLNAAMAVSLGAFGAHALKARLSTEMLNIYQTAAQYHFYHALGLIAAAFVATLLPDSSLPKWAGWLLSGGIVLFCGSLPSRQIIFFVASHSSIALSQTLTLC